VIEYLIPSSPQESDELAKQEANAFSNGTLEDEARKKEHIRREGFRDHIHIAGKVIFWLIISIAIIIVLCWV